MARPSHNRSYSHVDPHVVQLRSLSAKAHSRSAGTEKYFVQRSLFRRLYDYQLTKAIPVLNFISASCCINASLVHSFPSLTHRSQTPLF
jgi:hypothetical protein